MRQPQEFIVYRGEVVNVEIWNNGKIVQRSRNLRGIVERAGKQGVRTVVVAGHLLVIEFRDGSSCQTAFASDSVLRGWIRRRRWSPDTVIVDGISRLQR